MKKQILEKDIQKAVVEYARSKDILAFKVSSFSTRGLPDYMFIKDGKVLFIEFKAPGKKATRLQEVVIEKIKREKIMVWVIDNIEFGKNAINLTFWRDTL